MNSSLLQVQELATCSDRRRLEVVRELTGEAAFEASRATAQREVEQGQASLDEVREAVEDLDKAIEELQADREAFR